MFFIGFWEAWLGSVIPQLFNSFIIIRPKQGYLPPTKMGLTVYERMAFTFYKALN